ncbi:hypothetical protein PAMP_016315 [Pampus punctatissimus]
MEECLGSFITESGCSGESDGWRPCSKGPHDAEKREIPACHRASLSPSIVSQSHASPSDNGIDGPHRGWVVAPSRDPIMLVPLRVATWKRGPTVITAWPSGGEDTLSVSPRRNA